MVLSFQNVTLPPSSPEETGVREFSLSLATGQAAWLCVDRETVVVDLACGLRNPDSGSVSFQGVDWLALDPQRAAFSRGQIGRIFWETAWISNLDLDENITLGRRHLDPHNTTAWRERLEPLCAAFELKITEGLRPAFATRQNLQQAQWVRALLADPRLLILENPAHNLSGEVWTNCLAAVARVREKGTAVLWVGPEDDRMQTRILGADFTVRPEG